MLKIRLRRMGKRHRPFYRVVVSDSRDVPTAPAVEELGHYDPLQTPPEIRIDVDRIHHWVGQGAQMSATIKKLVKGYTPGSSDNGAAATAPAETAPEKEAQPAPEVTEETTEEAPEAEAAAAEEGAEEATPETAADETPNTPEAETADAATEGDKEKS